MKSIFEENRTAEYKQDMANVSKMMTNMEAITVDDLKKSICRFMVLILFIVGAVLLLVNVL